MLFQVFSFLFLIVQCATLEYTLVAEAPNEETMATEVLASLNGARKLVNHRIGADIRWLKWDLSLAWMASKASCDSVDGSIRLRLSQGPTGYLVDDVTTNIKNFTDHILKNGADPANATEEFSKYYEFYRSDLTRVECAFKFCQGTGEETNLICFLGPRTQKDGPIFEMADKCDSCECRDSMCIESPFDWNAQTEEEFQAHVLKEFNGARSRFSLKAEVTSMSKLVWDDELTQSLNETGCPENGTIEFPLVGGDLFLGMAGGLAELGDMFGETSVEESSNEVYQWTSLYTILWPQMTKVGCIRPPDCSTSVLCQFGDISELTGKMFEKGVTCSKCPQGCEDGLCT